MKLGVQKVNPRLCDESPSQDALVTFVAQPLGLRLVYSLCPVFHLVLKKVHRDILKQMFKV